jgi:riboflavin synthase
VGAREYDPRTARWLQRDPIDAASGDPNLYRYCGNDPGIVARSRSLTLLVESISRMFTGLIEATGQVVAMEPLPDGGAQLTLEAFPMSVGESLAVNGVCLTVSHAEGNRLRFDLVPETLRRTNLGELKPGDRVNLERPLTPQSRIGGHFVQGHVDTTARLMAIQREGNGHILRLQLEDPRYRRYIVPKGSIAVDGISLTVVETGEDWFTVWIVPHTWQVTNLATRQRGDRLNIETDILARYVEQLLAFTKVEKSPPP